MVRLQEEVLRFYFPMIFSIIISLRNLTPSCNSNICLQNNLLYFCRLFLLDFDPERYFMNVPLTNILRAYDMPRMILGFGDPNQHGLCCLLW